MGTMNMFSKPVSSLEVNASRGGAGWLNILLSQELAGRGSKSVCCPVAQESPLPVSWDCGAKAARSGLMLLSGRSSASCDSSSAGTSA